VVHSRVLNADQQEEFMKRGKDSHSKEPLHTTCTSLRHFRYDRYVALLTLVVLFLTLAQAGAQLYTGSVTGLVSDPSGAIVPGAGVTLTDTEKGYENKVKSDSNGRYLFRSVPPGSYRISVDATGFETARREGIKLDVNQNISSDFQLRIGSENQVVDVKAGAVQIQTEDAVTGQVVNRRFVNDLPLLDRNFFNLTRLAPGVVETNVPNSTSPVNFNSNGSRNSTADVLIDGASATNFEQNSGQTAAPYTPSVDSVEEFKVEQSNFTAEFGFAGTSIINVVTRSGTNQFHGSAFEFLRNSATDANEWFNNKNGNPIPPLKKHDFGGSIGGPIFKNKTFFFFDFEGRRERNFASNTFGVPTLCERGIGTNCAIGDPNNVAAGLTQGASKLGNFAELCLLSGASFDNTGQCTDPAGQLWDPYTGVFDTTQSTAVRSNFIPFNNLAGYISPGNPKLAGTPFALTPGVPGNLLDPVASKFFQLFPLPTVAATDLATIQSQNFFASGVSKNSTNQWDLKIDHRFSDHDSLSVKYSQQSADSSSFNCFQDVADPCTGGPVNSTRHLVSINHVHTFGPRLLLTLTYGYVRGFDFAHGIGGEFPNIDQAFADVGFPSYLNHGFHVFPTIEFTADYNTQLGSQIFSITREGQDSHHLAGTVGWLHGNHDFKFGGEGRLHRINHTNPGWPAGDFTFDRSGSNQIANNTDNTAGGDSLASFLIGVGPPGLSGGGCTPCQVGFVNAVSTQSFRYAAFVQDNYRPTSKLTMNLGLRYELSMPRTERFNRMNWLDPNVASPLQVPGLPPLRGGEVFANPNDRSNYYIDYKAIQPRFGFAYQLHQNFVFRGGYGIYYSTPRSGAAGTGPWGYQGFDVQPPWITTFQFDHATPYNTLKNPSCQFPQGGNVVCGVPAPPGSAKGLLNDIGTDAVGPIRRISQNIPYEQAWSFGFQVELPKKVLLDTSYVGKKGTHLYLGGFRNNNFLGPQVLQLTPGQRANLFNPVPNPFFFDPTSGGTCDPTRFICDPTVALSAQTIPAFQSPDQPLHVPFPQFTSFSGDSPPIANSIYHALQIRLEREFANGLQFLATYAWSKSIDNASATDDSNVFLGGGTTDGSTLAVQNPFDLGAERAVSVFDIPHVFQFSYVYQFPFGRGKRFGSNIHPVLNAILGGWQTNGIIRITAGRPVIPLLDSSNPIPTWGQRPDLLEPLRRASTSVQASTDPNTGTSYFANPDALAQPADFTLGTAPRTISNVRQPGARDVSMSLFKEFPLAAIHEGMRLEFRAESFNTFNHPQFAGPNTNVGSSDFGFITSTVNSPREMQFGLKLYF
jgi:Carboxypeptidase regulatory-like domain/TonB dependent receptor